jgi:hypothetical protein
MLATSTRQAGWAQRQPVDGASTYLPRPFQLPRRLLPPPLHRRRLKPGPPWLRRRWPSCGNTQSGSRGVQSRVCSAEQQQLSGVSRPRCSSVEWGGVHAVVLCPKQCQTVGEETRRNGRLHSTAQQKSCILLQEASRQLSAITHQISLHSKARQQPPAPPWDGQAHLFA